MQRAVLSCESAGPSVALAGRGDAEGEKERQPALWPAARKQTQSARQKGLCGREKETHPSKKDSIFVSFRPPPYSCKKKKNILPLARARVSVARSDARVALFVCFLLALRRWQALAGRHGEETKKQRRTPPDKDRGVKNRERERARAREKRVGDKSWGKESDTRRRVDGRGRRHRENDGERRKKKRRDP